MVSTVYGVYIGMVLCYFSGCVLLRLVLWAAQRAAGKWSDGLMYLWLNHMRYVRYLDNDRVVHLHQCSFNCSSLVKYMLSAAVNICTSA